MPVSKNRERRCQECGKVYILGIDSTQHKYCSIKCRNTYHNKNGGKKYRNSFKGKQTLKAWRLKSDFGISISQYDQMLIDQNYSCAICFTKTPTGVNWHVDHCHETGKVRGLLCSCCNQALGLFKDNPTNLYNAIKYITKK